VHWYVASRLNAPTRPLTATLSDLRDTLRTVELSSVFGSVPQSIQRRVADARTTRWDSHRVEARARIVDAAIRAIERHGVAASMEDIATEANASKPKLYRHFKDRADLHGAIAHKFGSLIWASAERTVLQAKTSTPIIVFLREAIEEYVVLVDKYPSVFTFLIQNQLFQFSGSGRGGAAEELRTISMIIAEQFERRLEDLKMDTSTVQLAVSSILGSGLSATGWWLEQGREEGVARAVIVDHLVETTWAIIAGSAELVGVSIDRRRVFDDPDFMIRCVDLSDYRR
jgi:AcrR family transcriptional regulator